ncbi:hypothetical protein FN846DRAFT_907620 [Sphaerosporella brunnea]|uniref:Uncharacterized protein n=1 Tax=Sphaerosporella brunnea TaxID=1250544 RepID=A0A5J5EVZ6_9PEZI|nr:hypothetical protein FN846DRAFT_907620 [Sphaerosporella brunnea]
MWIAMEMFPLAYHQEQQAVKPQLIARGRKFGSFSGKDYKFYEGLAFFRDKKEGIIRLMVNSRIMGPVKFVAGRYTQSPKTEDEQTDTKFVSYVSSQLADTITRAAPTKALDSKKKMTDEQLLICSPTVLGFAEFAIEYLDEIAFNSRAFDTLVLPNGQ